MGGRSAGRVLLVAGVLLAPGRAWAQDGLLDGFTAILDTRVSSGSTTTTDKRTGTAVKTDITSIYPRLTVNAQTLLLPKLRLSTGGVFESNVLFTTDDDARKSTIRNTRLRPFFDLRSTNQILAPGFSYHRRENWSATTGLPGVRLVNEDYAGYLGWRPEGLPQTDIQVVRTNRFDETRRLQDLTRSLGSIVTRYSLKNVNAFYQGTSLATDDRLDAVKTRQVSNGGKIDFTQSFLQRRLLWNTTYSRNHLSVSTTARAARGEVAIPVIPSAALSSVSDTPETSRLTANPLLVDANQSASAGVNLGVPPPGSDARARNMGLDFLDPTEVNRLWVWVDRELPVEIASTFTWDVYSSPDNLLWTREGVVTSATFSPFDNRFELDFRTVKARYVKVVVPPLSSARPDASKYPDIFVTELQVFLVRAAAGAETRVKQTRDTLNTDLRFRLLDAPLLFYEGSYSFIGTEGDDRYVLSNGLSFNHQFTRVVSAFGRGAFERGREAQGPRQATIANATINVEPTRALTGSVLYTRQDEEVAGRPLDRQGVSIQTNAQVYQGVDLQAAVGWNFLTRDTGERLRDRFVLLTASVVPRPDLTITANYGTSATRREGAPADAPDYRSRRLYATVAYDPFRTLHLVVAQELVTEQGSRRRTFTNVGLSWAPFPDGTLQVSFAYNEAFRPLMFGTERDLRPGVRWKFARRSFLELFYQRIRTEFDFERTVSEVMSADVRLFF